MVNGDDHDVAAKGGEWCCRSAASWPSRRRSARHAARHDRTLRRVESGTSRRAGSGNPRDRQQSTAPHTVPVPVCAPAAAGGETAGLDDGLADTAHAGLRGGMKRLAPAVEAPLGNALEDVPRHLT